MVPMELPIADRYTRASSNGDPAVLQVILESETNAEMLMGNGRSFMMSAARVPVPAMSVTLECELSSRPQEDDVPSTLLQSCLKRQLVGCALIWYRNSGTATMDTCCTRIRFPFEQRTWAFRVDSIITSPSSPNQTQRGNNEDNSVVACIVPSTRITIHYAKVNSIETDPYSTSSDDIKPEQIELKQTSPTARILVDTITCIGEIHAVQATRLDNGNGSNMGVGDIPRAFLLSGPPGVGKTHSVRLAVQNAGSCHLVVLQGSELLGQSSGHTGEAAKLLERQFVDAMNQTLKMGPNFVVVIFLDECDALLANPDGQISILEATLSCLLDRMHSDRQWKSLMVIAATNRVDSLPSSLRRPGRFDREIPLAPPDASTRMGILRSLLQDIVEESPVPLSNNSMSQNDLREIADATVGYVAADLASLVRRAWLLQQLHRPGSDVGAQLKVSRRYVDWLKQAMSDVGASALRDAALKAPPATTWDDVAGDPGGAKTALRQAIEWPRTKRRAYEALQIEQPRGILLHGPPGCAKTTLARAAAGASGVAFLSLSPADVYSSSYVGDAEAVVRRAFTLARSAAPCVLFFDEIDAIVGSDNNLHHSSSGLGRGSSTSAETRVLSTFLNEMDGIDGSRSDGVLVLGATNRPGTLDAALLRPGRFDKVIYVAPPDYEGRRAILSMQCQNWHCPINIDQLAEDAYTGNMTGAEIVGACREAAMQCFREAVSEKSLEGSVETTTSTNHPQTPLTIRMREEYLVEALQSVKPLLSDATVLAEFESFEQHRKKVAS